MTYDMLDSAFAPTSQQLAEAKASGIKAWAGYLPSPSAYHAWSEQDFDNVQAVMGVLPIYVQETMSDGKADGEAALAALKTYGLSGYIAVDIERGTWDADNAACLTFVKGWAIAVRAGGVKAGVYGPSPLMDALTAADVDFKWLALWPGSKPTELPAGIDIWQWQGGHEEFGANVDSSISDLNLTPTPVPVPIPNPSPIPEPAPTPSQPPTLGDQAEPTWFAFPPGERAVVTALAAPGYGWNPDWIQGPSSLPYTSYRHGQIVSLDASLLHGGETYYHENGGAEGWLKASDLKLI